MANPDSFLGGTSQTNFNQPDKQKVIIDDMGNPQLSPNYAARKNKANVFRPVDGQPTDAESGNGALPAIGMTGNSGGAEAMKYTMTNFLQSADEKSQDEKSNNGSAYRNR